MPVTTSRRSSRSARGVSGTARRSPGGAWLPPSEPDVVAGGADRAPWTRLRRARSGFDWTTARHAPGSRPGRPCMVGTTAPSGTCSLAGAAVRLRQCPDRGRCQSRWAAVADTGWTGVFGMGTPPRARGRGAAAMCPARWPTGPVPTKPTACTSRWSATTPRRSGSTSGGLLRRGADATTAPQREPPARARPPRRQRSGFATGPDSRTVTPAGSAWCRPPPAPPATLGRVRARSSACRRPGGAAARPGAAVALGHAASAASSSSRIAAWIFARAARPREVTTTCAARQAEGGGEQVGDGHLRRPEAWGPRPAPTSDGCRTRAGHDAGSYVRPLAQTRGPMSDGTG